MECFIVKDLRFRNLIYYAKVMGYLEDAVTVDAVTTYGNCQDGMTVPFDAFEVLAEGSEEEWEYYRDKGISSEP